MFFVFGVIVYIWRLANTLRNSESRKLEISVLFWYCNWPFSRILSLVCVYRVHEPVQIIDFFSRVCSELFVLLWGLRFGWQHGRSCRESLKPDQCRTTCTVRDNRWFVNSHEDLSFATWWCERDKCFIFPSEEDRRHQVDLLSASPVCLQKVTATFVNNSAYFNGGVIYADESSSTADIAETLQFATNIGVAKQCFVVAKNFSQFVYNGSCADERVWLLMCKAGFLSSIFFNLRLRGNGKEGKLAQESIGNC